MDYKSTTADDRAWQRAFNHKQLTQKEWDRKNKQAVKNPDAGGRRGWT